MSTGIEKEVQQPSIKLPSFGNIKPSDRISLNVVKALEDSDFQYAKLLCDGNTNWEIEYESKKSKVWSRQIPNSSLQMFKSRCEFKDITADICYNVLQDSDYRYKWDKYLTSTKRIAYLDQNNDVCYYTVGSLPPFRNRDFVLFRSWFDNGNEKFILAHSVWHDKFPPTKDYIRGIVYLTIHFVRRTTEKGCQFNYLTLVDPKGKLPNWLINRVTKTIAPRLCKKLRKACIGYERWKINHNRTNENNFWKKEGIKDIPKLNLVDCIYKGDDIIIEDWPDESRIQPCAITDEDEKEEEDEEDNHGKK